MEGTWHAKWNSSLPSSLPILQFPAMESRTQVRMGVGQYSHPSSVQHGCTNERASREGPMMLDTFNVGPKTGKPDNGNYFLALLSASPQPFQCEIPSSSVTRLPTNAGTLPILESTVVYKASSSTVEGSNPITWLPQAQGSECIRNEAELLSVSLRDLPAVSLGRAMLSHDAAQTGNSPLHGFNSSRQAPCHAVFSYTTGSKDPDPCIPGVTQTFSKLQHTREGTSHGFTKQALESQYSLPSSASAYLRGYPRVFCLTTGGVLLISETGHLGIICLCHNHHMSVSNFCEHSGSSAADPGDSVRMESGETLGQWRRLYFPKLGIKMRDENSGWDWPDLSTGTSASSELKASHLQNTAKDSFLRQDIGVFGRKGMSSQPCSELISFTNPLSEQVNFESFADCFVRDAQQRNAYGECDVVKNSNGISHAALPIFMNNQNVLPFGETHAELLKGTVRKEAQEDGYRSVTECVGIVQKSGDPYSINTSMESLKSFTNDNSGSRYVNPAPSLLYPDAFSSNFELRLGQPSEQSQACNGSFAPLKSQMMDLVIEPRVLQYDSMKQRELQQFWQHPQQESLAKKETNKEGDIFQMTDGFSSENVGKVDNGTVRSSSVQMFCPQIRSLANNEDGMLLEDANRLVSSTEQLMAGILGADYPVDKCELGDPYKCKVLGTGFSNQIVIGKSFATGANSSSNSLSMPSVHTMPFTEAKSHAVTGGNRAYVGSTSHVGQSSYVSGTLYSAYDLKSSGQVGLSSTGFHDPSITPGPASLSSLSPVSFPVRNQMSLPNIKSISHKEESIHSAQHKCDENSWLCALRNIVGMSMHDHEIANHDFSQDDGRLCCHTAMQMQRNEDKEDMIRMKLIHGSFLPGRDTSEVSVRSLHTCNPRCLGGGCPCCLAGARSAWNLMMPQEIAFHSKEIDAPSRYCCCSHSHHEQCLLRHGKNAHGFTEIDEYACCHQNELNATLAGKFGCFGRMRCLAGNCCSRLEIPSGSLHEHNDHDHAAGRSSFLHGPLIDRRSCAPCGDNVVGCDSLKFDCQSTVWRQIPGRSKVNSGTTSTDMPAEVVNAEGEVDCMFQNTYLRGSVRAPAESMLNEQQMSNVCSEGSAPAVTEFSLSSGDNCAYGENATFKINSIVDEESAIKKSISSSDATDAERMLETTSLLRKVRSVFPASSIFADSSSRKFSGEAKLTNSVRLKKLKNNGSRRPVLHEPIGTGSKMPTKEKTYKVKRLESSFHTSGQITSKYDVLKCDGSFNHTDEPLQLDEQKLKPGSCVASGQSNHKRRRSMLSYTASINKKSEGSIEQQNGHLFDTLQREEGIKGGILKVLSTKKPTCNEKKIVHDKCLVQDVAMSCVDHEKVNKRINYGFSPHTSVCQENNLMRRKQRPTVTGNSGIITNGDLSEGLPKPLKFGSLSLILKTAKRCLTAADKPSKFSALSKAGKTCNGEGDSCDAKLSTWTSEDNEVPSQSLNIGDNQFVSVLKGEQTARMVRKRSLCELTWKDKQTNESNKRISHSNISGVSFGVSCKKDRKWVLQSTLRSSDKLLVNGVGDIHQHMDVMFQQKHKRASKPFKRKKSVLDGGTFCCVCRNNEMDDCNRLLQCESCLIKVHQGCYGVLKLPKGRWLCRPCSTGSKNIVCVLCGYQGGAMTRALKSQKIIRSLLQAREVGKRLKPVTDVSLSEIKDEVGINNCTSTAEGHGKRECSLNEIMKTGIKSLDAGKWTNLFHPGKNHQISSVLTSNLLSKNGVIDSLLNPAVKQWVHMVCGLWMPGTRCPNVDTMSAFDVSGVACPKKNKVCSMCRRPGGSCIRCRVDGCTMMFHPWCAHQKGLRVCT